MLKPPKLPTVHATGIAGIIVVGTNFCMNHAPFSIVQRRMVTVEPVSLIDAQV